jgi:hypothetical protein
MDICDGFAKSRDAALRFTVQGLNVQGWFREHPKSAIDLISK